MDDTGSPSIALPLIGAALCTLFLGLALGYCMTVTDESYVFSDDESSEPESERASDPVALASDR